MNRTNQSKIEFREVLRKIQTKPSDITIHRRAHQWGLRDRLALKRLERIHQSPPKQRITHQNIAIDPNSSTNNPEIDDPPQYAVTPQQQPEARTRRRHRRLR